MKQKASKITVKAAKSKHVDKKRLLKTFGLLLGLIILVALGLFLIQQYNSKYPAEGIAGKAYADLSAEQKQGYNVCYKEGKCAALLSTAQQTKNYAEYRTCSKGCYSQALAQKPEDFYCTDSDGVNFTNKGIVTSYFYPRGKEDYCLEINGKNYLFEGKCAGNKAIFVQKNCGEMGSYGCEGGKCVEMHPTFNSILQEPISQEWINQFNADFKIEFKAYVPIIEYPDGGWGWDETNKIEFTAEEKDILTKALYKAVYSMSRVDSYFTKPLPWTSSQSYYSWLKNSVGTIIFYADPNSLNSAPPGKIRLNGYNIINNVNNGMLTTWFNQDLNSPNIGQGIMLLITILTHEARHNDKIKHVSCKNSNNMDENLKTMGAHGVNVMLRHWMKYLLPAELVQSAYDEKVDWMFQHDSFLDRMCSLDPIAKTLEQDDLDWVEDVSGHPLDFNPDIMWTVEFNNELNKNTTLWAVK